MLLRIAAGVAVCATGLGVAGAAAKIPPEWITAQKQPYYEVSRAVFAIKTLSPGNQAACDFKGGAKYVLNESSFRDEFTATTCTSGDGAYLWAKTCKAGPQTVKFTKRVYLPGNPLTLEGSLLSLKNRRLTFMEIEINGHALFHSSVSFHKKKGRTTGFNVGWNTLTITAAKGKTGPCNKSTADTGIYAALRATFAADVSATIPPPVLMASPGFRIPITVKNNGPSAAMVGNVSFRADTSKLFSPDGRTAILLLTDANKGEALQECTYFGGASFTMSCVLGVLEAGETVTITAQGTYNAPEGNFSDKFKISWGAAGGLPDPKPENDGGTRDQYVCRPGPCGPR